MNYLRLLVLALIFALGALAVAWIIDLLAGESFIISYLLLVVVFFFWIQIMVKKAPSISQIIQYSSE